MNLDVNESLYSDINKLTEEYGACWGRKQIRHCLHFAGTFPDFKILVSLIRQLSWTHFIESKNLIENRGKFDDE